ncbi:callose synthase 2 [Ceratobasidium sp. AG-Ba]|nr:callose synthase 2 [Ceratobasidium sp. AG-Ba]QRW07808.1 callose synthase 2 [Ceratobasidium sp. AG-Ba]
MDILDAFDIDELYDDPRSNVEPIEPYEWDLELEPEILPEPELEETLSGSEEVTEHASVREVVLLMKKLGLRLDTFLLSLFYGNRLCIGDPILRGARGQVTQSKLLHAILNNIHTPSKYTGSRPQGASESMYRWAWRHVSKLARRELNQLAEHARINRLDDDTNSFPDLEYIKFNSLKERVMSFTPQLAKFLTLAAETKPHGRTRRKQGEAGYEIVENSFVSQ